MGFIDLGPAMSESDRASDLGALAAAVITIGLAVRHCVGEEYDEALVSAIKIALKAAQKGNAAPPEVIVALVEGL